jgi:hypothetical protein
MFNRLKEMTKQQPTNTVSEGRQNISESAEENSMIDILERMNSCRATILLENKLVATWKCDIFLLNTVTYKKSRYRSLINRKRGMTNLGFQGLTQSTFFEAPPTRPLSVSSCRRRYWRQPKIQRIIHRFIKNLPRTTFVLCFLN